MIFVANLHMLSFLQTPASARRRWGTCLGRFAPDVEEVARGAAVSMEVGFPGVEPYDKFLIEPIEESEEPELELDVPDEEE